MADQLRRLWVVQERKTCLERLFYGQLLNDAKTGYDTHCRE